MTKEKEVIHRKMRRFLENRRLAFGAHIGKLLNYYLYVHK